MKKPNIIYCNVIREDKEQGRVAINGTQIDSIINNLIKSTNLLQEVLGITVHPEAVQELKEMILLNKELLEKIGCK